MKVLKFLKLLGAVLLGFALISGAFVAWAVSQTRPPDDQISEYLLSEAWADCASLTPDLFEPFGARADIEDQLNAAGYRRGRPVPRGSCEYGDLLGREIYAISGNSLACSYDLYVALLFSDTGFLESAVGGVSASCL